MAAGEGVPRRVGSSSCVALTCRKSSPATAAVTTTPTKVRTTDSQTCKKGPSGDISITDCGAMRPVSRAGRNSGRELRKREERYGRGRKQEGRFATTARDGGRLRTLREGGACPRWRERTPPAFARSGGGGSTCGVVVLREGVCFFNRLGEPQHTPFCLGPALGAKGSESAKRSARFITADAACALGGRGCHSFPTTIVERFRKASSSVT